MGETRSEYGIPYWIKQYPLENLEVVVPEDYETYHRMKREFAAKGDAYTKETGRNWDVTVEYEVPDITSLCWLELFTCVQHGIPARRCSLCGRYFIVTGRANMRQCPECRKNPSKAWRKAQVRAQEEDVPFRRPPHSEEPRKQMADSSAKDRKQSL